MLLLDWNYHNPVNDRFQKVYKSIIKKVEKNLKHLFLIIILFGRGCFCFVLDCIAQTKEQE